MEPNQPSLPPEQSSSPFTPTPTSKSPAMTWVAGAIVIALLVALGAGAYYLYSKSALSPQQVLLKSLEAMPKTKSAYFSANAKGSVRPQKDNANNIIGAETADFSMKIEGSSDVFNPESPKVDLTLKGDINGKSTTGDIGAAMELFVRGVDEKVYFSINDFSLSYKPVKPDLFTTSMMGMVEGIIDSLKGKWIITDGASTTPEKKEIPQEVRDELRKFEYIESIDNIGDEVVNGVKTHHYKITVNTDTLFTIVAKAEDADTAKNLNNIKLRGLDNQNPTIEVWIGKNDYRVYKMMLNPANTEDLESKTTMTVEGDIVFKDYDKPVTIDVPKDAVPIQQLMQEMFGSMLGAPSASSSFGSPSTIKRQ